MKRLIKDDDITCGLSHLYVCAGAWTRQEVVSEKLADMREKAHGRDIALEAAKRATWRIHKNRRHTHLRFKNQARLPSDGAPSFVTAFIRLFARRTDGTSTASCSDPAVHSIALGYSNSSRKDESPSVRAAPTTRARRRSPRDGFRACAVCHSIARGSPDADFGLRSGTCHVIQRSSNARPHRFGVAVQYTCTRRSLNSGRGGRPKNSGRAISRRNGPNGQHLFPHGIQHHGRGGWRGEEQARGQSSVGDGELEGTLIALACQVHSAATAAGAWSGASETLMAQLTARASAVSRGAQSACLKETALQKGFNENWGFLRARPEECKPRAFETRLVKYFSNGRLAPCRLPCFCVFLFLVAPCERGISTQE